MPSYELLLVSHLILCLYAFLVCAPFVTLSVTDQLFEATVNCARTINGTQLYSFKPVCFVPFFRCPVLQSVFRILEIGYKGA